MNFIIREMLKPATRRIGTGLAAYALSQGFAQDVSTAVGQAAVVVAGFALDLTLSHLNRRKGF
jgi:hypothetical protein